MQGDKYSVPADARTLLQVREGLVEFSALDGSVLANPGDSEVVLDPPGNTVLG